MTVQRKLIMKVKCPFCGKFMEAWFDLHMEQATRTCKCGFAVYLPKDCGYYPEMKITLVSKQSEVET